MKRKDATIYDQQTDLEAPLVRTFAAGCTMRGRTTDAKGRIKTLKTKLSNAQLALAKLENESLRTEANL